jgi:3-hydroxybutyryl-CoA dehydratase
LCPLNGEGMGICFSDWSGWRWLYSQRGKPLENSLELIHFEDLPLGEQWTTRRRTITDADLAAYVGLSGDFNPLYADVEHARRGPYGGIVVPAPLVAAVVAGLGAMDAPVPHTVAMVGWSWKFRAPVRPGDSIRSRWRLNRKRDVEDARWGLVTWQVEVENQNGDLVALGEVVRLVARRDAGEAPEEPDAGEGARSGRRRRRRRGGGNGGQTPEAVASRLAAESAAAPDAVEVSPIVQPEAAELAGTASAAAPAEPGPPPARRRRRRRGNGNSGGGGQAAETPPSPPTQPEGPPPRPEVDSFF